MFLAAVAAGSAFGLRNAGWHDALLLWMFVVGVVAGIACAKAEG